MNNYNQRMKQIDEFLKSYKSFFSQLLDSGNRHLVSSLSLYKQIGLIGVSDDDKKKKCLKNTRYDNYPDFGYYDTCEMKSVMSQVTPQRPYQSELGDYWVQNFGGRKYGAYCVFKDFNGNYEFNYDNSINIFIPFKSDYLKDGVTSLIEFLYEKNFYFQASVARTYRNDNFVVRVYTPEDAKLVSDFVNNNEYIQKGLCKPNPFAIQSNGLAYSYDDKFVYLQVVSLLISDYMNDKVKTKKINKINIQDFYNYCLKIYKHLLKKYQKNNFFVKVDYGLGYEFRLDLEEDSELYSYIEEYKFLFKYGDHHRPNPGEILKNYIDVIELFLRTFDPKFTYEDYIEFYERVSGNKFNKTTQQNSSEKTQNTTSDNNISNYDLLIHILVTMTKKYNSNSAFICLEEYLKTGDGEYLTNTNNIRQIVLQSNFRESMNNILNNNMSLRDFLNQLGITEEYIISKCGSISGTRKPKK